MHDGPAGGHYGEDTIAHKILRAGYIGLQCSKTRRHTLGSERCVKLPVLKQNLVRIIHKSVADNQRNWHNALTNALWANRVTPKVALGNSPYFLIYGQEAILPCIVPLPRLQLSQASRGKPSTLLQKRVNQLVRLEELRDNATNKFKSHQMIVKRWFDRHLAGDKDYQFSELVLKWDKLSEPKGKHTKFQHLWLGSFQFEKKNG
eukprot:PITA_20678